MASNLFFMFCNGFFMPLNFITLILDLFFMYTYLLIILFNRSFMNCNFLISFCNCTYMICYCLAMFTNLIQVLVYWFLVFNFSFFVFFNCGITLGNGFVKLVFNNIYRTSLWKSFRNILFANDFLWEAT